MIARFALALFLPVLSIGCAAAGPTFRPSVIRGSVATEGPVVRPIVAGPVSLRGYAQSGGGRLFVAADCSRPDAASANTPLIVDERTTVDVPIGRMACLVVEGSRPYELLWRARPLPTAALAANQAAR